MRTAVVFSLTGPDRVGIVEEVTQILVGLDCNVETSRMARLGGEFAILMAVSAPEGVRVELEGAFGGLADEGYRVCVSPGKMRAEVEEDATAFHIEVTGADHEGIVHEIARGLSNAGINIESAETGTASSPISGTPLFMMKAIVAVPHEVADSGWREALELAGEQAGVDISIAPVAE